MKESVRRAKTESVTTKRRMLRTLFEAVEDLARHGPHSHEDGNVFVNGQPVTQMALGPGDRISIGDTEIEFQVRA